MYKILFLTVGFHEGYNYAAAQLESIRDAFPDADFLYETRSAKLKKTDLAESDTIQAMTRLTDKMKDIDYDFVVGTGDRFFTKNAHRLNLKLFKDAKLVQFEEKQSQSNIINVSRFGPNSVGNIVSTKHLYIEERDYSKVNIFIDHSHKTGDQTNKILTHLEKIKSKYDIDVYHQGSDGIVCNVFKVETNKGYKLYTLEELSKIYRKCDLFFPTHRESLGQVALELGACGAMTVLEPWMYPSFTIKQTDAIFYSNIDDLDWDSIMKKVSRENKEATRKKVLSHCGPEIFREKFCNILERIAK
jgi:hypothetical protein